MKSLRKRSLKKNYLSIEFHESWFKTLASSFCFWEGRFKSELSGWHDLVAVWCRAKRTELILARERIVNCLIVLLFNFRCNLDKLSHVVFDFLGLDVADSVPVCSLINYASFQKAGLRQDSGLGCSQEGLGKLSSYLFNSELYNF